MNRVSPKASFGRLDLISSADLSAVLELLDHNAFAGQSRGLRSLWEALREVAQIELDRRQYRRGPQPEKTVELWEFDDLTVAELLVLENLFFRLSRERLGAGFFKACYMTTVDARIRGECQIRELERVFETAPGR